MEEADITLDADGGVTLIIGTMTNGQGHHTAYAQLLNDKLGIDPDKVRMVQGDSDITLISDSKTVLLLAPDINIFIGNGEHITCT